jgi:hypothetical protein
MTPEERDYHLKENSEAIISLIMDVRANVLKNFESASPDHLSYIQGQFALLNYLQGYIETAGVALETLQEE